ncbi:MG2 domain protein [Candidatus Gugararchaeum adminiculabundum]|nr:MG2 domain protein [Candidatus Gugararchaeum adminiculabundum]
MGMKNGQASVELVVLLAVALFILGAVVIVANNEIRAYNALQEKNKAELAVKQIVTAADQVYLQGSGAKKKIWVELPGGISSANVSGHYVSLRVRGSDTSPYSSKGELYGTVPPEEGGHWLWVVSSGNKVRIGSVDLDIDPTLLVVYTFTSNFDQYYQKSFKVSNVGVYNETVDVLIVWDEANVTVRINNTANRFTLAPGASRTILVDFYTTASSIGSFNGYIRMNSSKGDEARVDLAVNLVNQECVRCSELVAGCVPAYYEIKTFANSDYSVEKTAFDPGENVYYSVRNYKENGVLSNTPLRVKISDPVGNLTQEMDVSTWNATGTYLNFFQVPDVPLTGAWNITVSHCTVGTGKFYVGTGTHELNRIEISEPERKSYAFGELVGVRFRIENLQGVGVAGLNSEERMMLDVGDGNNYVTDVIDLGGGTYNFSYVPVNAGVNKISVTANNTRVNVTAEKTIYVS